MSIENKEETEPFELDPDGKDPPKAECLLLFAARGGQIGQNGRPILSHGPVDTCGNPTDCFQCPLMQEELNRHAKGHVIWVCPSCIKEAVKIAKEKGINFNIPGHFTEGECQFKHCIREQNHSVLLQLFIGDVNQ